MALLDDEEGDLSAPFFSLPFVFHQRNLNGFSSGQGVQEEETEDFREGHTK